LGSGCVVVDMLVVLATLIKNDIESIEVLKDAASAAIYGTRAATGVIFGYNKKGCCRENGSKLQWVFMVLPVPQKVLIATPHNMVHYINKRSVAVAVACVFKLAAPWYRNKLARKLYVIMMHSLFA